MGLIIGHEATQAQGTFPTSHDESGALMPFMFPMRNEPSSVADCANIHVDA